MIHAKRANFLVRALKEHRYLETCAKSGQLPFVSQEDSVLLQSNGGKLKPLSPTVIVEYGQELLDKYSWQLNAQDLYDIHEQVFVACLQSSNKENRDLNLKRAQLLLDTLRQTFPDSNIRVGRLQGMMLEASGKYKEAIALYQTIIDLDETNIECRKRIISALVSQQLITEAINALNEFLQVFMNDVEAWEMLADLYSELKRYEEASFCIEEILLLRPTNWTYHVKYASLQLLVSSPESLSLARKYYCHALDLCPNSSEALEGIRLCNTKIDTLRQSDAQQAKRLQQITPSPVVEKELAILVNSRLEKTNN